MSEGGSLLSLDPAVMGLQIIAFILLFAVLRKYLFRPLLAVMAQREKEIADGLDAGERARGELAAMEQERQGVMASAREEGRQLVRQAVQEGQRARDQIVSEARDEAQEIRQRGRESIELERE